MSEMVFILGAMASGKSTQVESYLAKKYIRFNRDTLGGSYAGMLHIMVPALKGGANIVMDNVFATIAERKPFLDAARQWGYDSIAIQMTTSIEDCLYNACQRMWRKHGRIVPPEELANFKKKDPGVFPPAVLFKHRKTAESPVLSEGWKQIITVPFIREHDPLYVNKAIILDKDGTIAKTKSGKHYPTKPDDIEILPGRREKLVEMQKQGYMLLGVSNQSGVAKGEMGLLELARVFNKTNELLGINIDWNFCPHRIPPVSCYCRKPGVGLLVQHIETHKLDPRLCILVGDMTSDKTAAIRAGMKFVHADTFFKE